jgi:MSHA biogenesis protein MshM
MDVSRFSLRQRPFPASPDTACYYPATGHELALTRLLRGLADGAGVLVLTGEPGTGKTLLCHRLLAPS